jgi:hypothetical protein
MLSLLAWVVIFIPTSLFVIFVLIKSYWEQRTAAKAKEKGVAWA